MARNLKKKTNEEFESEKEVLSTGDCTLNENGETPEYDLEAGYEDEDGVLHKTFTLREINGKDEEAINKGDIKSNTSKAISVLLSRCCLSIGTLTKKDLGPKKWEEIIKGLYVGDQDIMVLKLREISIGSEYETVHTCPHCGTELKTYFDFSELEIIPFKGERLIPFDLPKGYKDKNGNIHKTGTMRLPVGLDREVLNPLMNKNLGKARTTMFTRLCKFDSGYPVTDDIMSSLVLKDRDYLQNLLDDNLFGVNPKVDITCTNCGEEFTGNLNAINFI